ncbi:uncharacterized protein LOC135497341 isoform X2 [Lineus longissimus]|uniref:uncharacterized protein LOC135497341 isoform X2 n=1 Tax=Lineus longissimus TaxID=88925 RepID=UPI00315CA280
MYRWNGDSIWRRETCMPSQSQVERKRPCLQTNTMPTFTRHTPHNSQQPKDCATNCPPLQPLNANQNSTEVYQGSVVKLDCAKGFRRIAGDTLLVCEANQTWSGKALICQGRACPEVPAELFTNVKPKLQFTNNGTAASKLGFSDKRLQRVGLWRMPGLWRMAGTSVISFKCRNGRYPTGGNTEITCRYDGTWSGRPLTCNPANLALKRLAFQIHTHTYGGEAALAVDGNTSPLWTRRSCTHTNMNRHETHPWLAVDLMEKYLIGSVSLTNRGDCCGNRLANFTIAVTNQRPIEGYPYRPQPSTVCWYSKDQQKQGLTKNYKCQAPLIGRYVVVSMQNGHEVLTLCEVQVFKKKGLAWLKPASQSSTFRSYTASRATDGNSNPNAVADTCSCTKVQGNPWWAVDLKLSTKINEVFISYPTDRLLENKMFNFTISVTNKMPGPSFVPTLTEVCLFQADRMNPGELKQFKCQKTMTGRYVVVSMKGRSMLSLCDVTVLG